MKKQISLFSFSMMVLNFTMLFAQTPGTNCLGYPHLLNITGFYAPCGNTNGKICFDYSAEGWNPIEDCEDLVVEISYPTTNFSVTDNGNFAYSVSGGISKLTLDPDQISAGIGTECFEGTLNVSNTVFTKKIYYASNPNVTFLSNTFKVDDIIPIGTSGNDTSLSSLTGSGGPLAAPPANGQSQRIAVEGTLNINQSYYFNTSFNNSNSRYSELIMMPGSKITVNGNVTMHTSLLNIHGCEGSTWEGIELLTDSPSGGSLDMGVRTTLSDANIGVEMNHKSKFHISDSEIINCGIGLGSFGPSPKTITFDGVNSIFGNLISNFLSCGEGIHLENTTKLDLTMTTGLPYLNIRYADSFAIYLKNTELEAMGLNIDGCGNGIWVETPNTNVILNNIICNGNGGTGVGIHTRGTNNLRVTNSLFSNWGTGINRGTNIANQYTQVQNVFMSQCIHNIWAVVLPSKADIQFNNLNAVGHNVWLSGIGTGQHQWNIQKNNALSSGTTPPNNMPSVSYMNRNIYLGNVRYAKVYQNENDFTSPYKNLTIHGGQNNVVGSNILSAPSSTQKNLEISGSPIAAIYCNTLGGASTAMTVMNDCAGSIVDVNDFSGATGSYNLVYGSSYNQNATSGKQNMAGNLFDASTLSTPRARHFAPENIALQSQYIVGKYRYSPGSIGGVAENFQGDSHYPHFTSQTSQWFLKSTTGIDHDNCVVELTYQEILEEAAQTDIGLLYARIDTVFGNEVAFDTKLKLYRHLENLQELTTLTGDFDIWHDSLSGTDFAKFIEFENLYKEAVSFNETDADCVDQLNLEIDSLGQILDSLGSELDSVVWWVTDTSTNTLVLDSAQIADFEAIKSLIKQKLDTFSILVMDKKVVLDSILDDLLSVNNSIGTQNTTSGENLKMINAYLLARFDPDFEGLSGEDSTQLVEIAEQCVGEGGEGVYIARALLAEHNLEHLEYEDECITERNKNSNIKQIPSASSLKIMPNPADGLTEVVLPNGHNISSLTLLDAYGHVVYKFDITLTQTRLEINTSELSTGIYFLLSSNGTESPVKFTVLH